MQTIPTFTGEVAAEDLGCTLIHEHIFVGDPELDRNFPHPEWDAAAAVETAVSGLTRLSELGVRTVVDLTVLGLGRDIELVRRVAERSPVHLIASTGYYASNVLPPYFQTHGPGRLIDGPDPLTSMFLSDIRDGIAGTRVRAGMLKVASDIAGITPDVERVFRAAAAAHLETNVPITTHSHSPSRGGFAQQQLLAAAGVPLDRVVIGHAGDSTDFDYLRALADNGSWLGFDRFGMSHMGNDEDRLRMLLRLIEAGYADRIVLSHDAAFFSRVTPPSWRSVATPEWRMDRISAHVLPALRLAGVSQEQVDQLMVRNPRSVLAGSQDIVMP